MDTDFIENIHGTINVDEGLLEGVVIGEDKDSDNWYR